MSSADGVDIIVDGRRVTARAGCTLAAAMLNAGCARFRDSVTDTARAPLCGMGICFECRVTVDGEPHVRSCMVTVRRGMVVRTAAEESGA